MTCINPLPSPSLPPVVSSNSNNKRLIFILCWCFNSVCQSCTRLTLSATMTLSTEASGAFHILSLFTWAVIFFYLARVSFHSSSSLCSLAPSSCNSLYLRGYMCVCLYGLSGRAHQKIQGHFLREPHVGNHLEQLGHHASIYIFPNFYPPTP